MDEICTDTCTRRTGEVVRCQLHASHGGKFHEGIALGLAEPYTWLIQESDNADGPAWWRQRQARRQRYG